MHKNNGAPRLELKLIVISSFVGFLAVVLTVLCCGLLVIREVLPYAGLSVMSRAALAAGAVTVSLYVRRRGRGERLIQSLSGGLLMLLYVILVSIIYKDGLEFWGVLISVAVVAAVCTLCSATGSKNGKMHKRRKR